MYTVFDDYMPCLCPLVLDCKLFESRDGWLIVFYVCTVPKMPTACFQPRGQTGDTLFFCFVLFSSRDWNSLYDLQGPAEDAQERPLLQRPGPHRGFLPGSLPSSHCSPHSGACMHEGPDPDPRFLWSAPLCLWCCARSHSGRQPGCREQQSEGLHCGRRGKRS